MPALVGVKQWHEGERTVHAKRGYSVFVGSGPSTAVDHLDHELSTFFVNLNCLPVATLDHHGRPWSSILTNDGHRNFIRCPDRFSLEITPRLSLGDPIANNLDNGVEVLKYKLFAGVGVEFANRRRNKLAGYVASFCRGEESQSSREMHLSLRVNSALGNCPKYINIRNLEPIERTPKLVHDEFEYITEESAKYKRLPREAIVHISKCDVTFLSTEYLPTDNPEESHLGMNHRGGKPGFVRVDPDNTDTLYLPDFSGNRLMQSIGNIEFNAYAGLTFPNFSNGDILYITGDTSVLYDEVSLSVMRGAASVVKLRVTGYIFVRHALPLIQDDEIAWSAYDPPVRYLSWEAESGKENLGGKDDIVAALKSFTLHEGTVHDDPTTISEPTLATFAFELSSPVQIKAGQHAILDFSTLLSPQAKTYKHMAIRPNGQKELNDDGVRTWTIASAELSPCNREQDQLNSKSFSITMRVKEGGAITPILFALGKAVNQCNGGAFDGNASLQVPLLGIAGDFILPAAETLPSAVQCNVDGTEILSATPIKLMFIASGIGITPFLSMLKYIYSQSSSTLSYDIDVIVSLRKNEINIFKDWFEGLLPMSDNGDASTTTATTTTTTKGVDVPPEHQGEANSRGNVFVHLLNAEFSEHVEELTLSKNPTPNQPNLRLFKYRRRLDETLLLSNEEGIGASNSLAISKADRADLVFICGSTSFEHTARSALRAVSFPPDRIRSESFAY